METWSTWPSWTKGPELAFAVARFSRALACVTLLVRLPTLIILARPTSCNPHLCTQAVVVSIALNRSLPNFCRLLSTLSTFVNFCQLLSTSVNLTEKSKPSAKVG
jgi:hypothetical protein